jgi:hypothetical protein
VLKLGTLAAAAPVDLELGADGYRDKGAELLGLVIVRYSMNVRGFH